MNMSVTVKPQRGFYRPRDLPKLCDIVGRLDAWKSRIHGSWLGVRSCVLNNTRVHCALVLASVGLLRLVNE